MLRGGNPQDNSTESMTMADRISDGSRRGSARWLLSRSPITSRGASLSGLVSQLATEFVTGKQEGAEWRNGGTGPGMG